MYKKYIVIIGLLLLITSISANEVFNLSYTLPGFYRLNNNKIDYLKLHKGFNLSSRPRLQLVDEPIKTETEIDYEKNLVILTPKSNTIKLAESRYLTIESYFQNNFRAVFYKKLREQIKDMFENTERTNEAGLIPEIVIELPKIALPKSVRRFMGNKAGRLSLDGSQRLTFSGNSTKRDEEGGENDTNQDFDLVLQQDLNLHLRGTIGEKIHVDVNHQSTSQEDAIPIPTEVNVSYDGDEDEIVQSIEGGNISLALSGSQFISYSVSSEGLFGIKSNLKAGNLEITTIMGKDEAKKSTQKWRGDAQADSVDIDSKTFINREMFFIDHPADIFKLTTDSDINGYNNNKIELDGTGKWIITSAGLGLLPDKNQEIQLYIDDHNVNNNQTSIQGKEINNDEDNFNFNILTEGTEFTVDYDSGIITLYPSNFSFTNNNTIPKGYTIGVTYTRNDGVVVGNDLSIPVEVKILHRRSQDNTDEEWDFMVRNIYSLGLQNVQNEGFDLKVYTENTDGTANYNAVDSLHLSNINLNEYLCLDTNEDGTVNGEDATVNLESGIVVFPFLKPFDALGDSIIYYKDQMSVTYKDFINHISVKGEIGKENISLNAMNILPGSVDIKFNGNKLIENVDYIVDYDFGNVTILKDEAKTPDAELDISFQYRPLFDVDNKTILGLRADMRFNENFKLGGTFIYQSETVKEDRPKIYNENRSIILSDIDGEFNFEVPFITRAIDFIPLIKTDEETTVNLSGEVAMSLPRIYGSKEQHDQKEAYIDDMEAILDSYPLGVQRQSWDFASIPTDKFTGNQISMGKAYLNYSNPQNIYAEDIYDPETLSQEEERDEVPVLACKIEPTGLGMPGVNNKYWAGIMKYVGNEMDFSEKKYIEFLVKVDTLNGNLSYQKPVVMHVDLGVVSEDFYKPGESSVPDKEDGIVTSDGLMDFGEDVGLDRIKDGDPGDDPNDNYDNIQPNTHVEWYPNINGTEGNDILDSEDLNNDGLLGTTEYYFEYSAVINEGLGFDGSKFMESEYNGWRLYRIPLADAENYEVVSNTAGKIPNLENISYARVWFEVEDSTRVKLVSLDLVGNKWQEHLIRDEYDNFVDDEDETMMVGIIDNQKDQHYQPAPYTVIKKDGEDTLEQSLTLEYHNLGEGHYGLATQSYRDKINLITYNKIRLWVYSEGLSELARDDRADTLIVRIGPDTLNYYQIKYPLQTVDYLPKMERDNWEAIELDFSDLTQLNNLDENKTRIEVEGMVLSLVGKPTLTNTKAISVGLQASDMYTGRLYIDDIRVADPYEEIGFAARTTLYTKFADFSDLNVNLTWKTENFQSNATRTKTPSYLRSLDLSISNKYYLQKFFPAEWGLSLPVTLSRNQSLGIPRFKANSDILRSDLPKEERDREKNTSLTRKISSSFSQNKTPGNKILAYTIKNTSLSGYVEDKKTKSSTSADTTITINLKHTYKLDFQKEDVGLKLFGNYYFYFFPYQLQNDITFNDKQPNRWYWETYVDSLENYWARQSNTIRTKTITTSSTVKYDLFSDISSSYDLSTTRNLLRRSEIYDINVGTEESRTQSINLDYDPAYLDKIFMFNVGGDVRYTEDHKRTGTVDTLYYDGNVNRNISASFTLKNRDMLQSLSQWMNKVFAPDSVALEKIDDGEEADELSNLDEKEIEELSNLDEKEIEELSKEEIKKKEEELQKNEMNNGKDNEEITNPVNGKDDGEGEGEEEETETTSKTKSNLFARIVGYVARLDNIQLSYTNQYKTTFEDQAERPEFLYQLGLPHILSEADVEMKNNNDKFTASTNFPILNFLTTAWSFSQEYQRTYSSNSNITITTVFPNVSVTLTELERLLKAENFLTSSRISSSYLYSLSQTGDIGFKEPDSEQIRFSMTPLISWIGNWKGDLSTNLSLNYSRTNNIRYFQNYATENRSTTKSATGSVSWTFAAAKGLKILFFKRTKLTNKFTTNVTFSVDDTVTETKDSAGKWEDSVDKFVYSIAPEASYEFNASISGGLTSSYEVQNDRKSKSQISTFRLGIFVEVIF